MSSTSFTPISSGLRLRTQLGCALAAISASAVIAVTVLGLFGQAASTPWLPDTPEAVALASACQTRPSAAERDACMQQAVAHWQQRGHKVRLAVAG